MPSNLTSICPSLCWTKLRDSEGGGDIVSAPGVMTRRTRAPRPELKDDSHASCEGDGGTGRKGKLGGYGGREGTELMLGSKAEQEMDHGRPGWANAQLRAPWFWTPPGRKDPEAVPRGREHRRWPPASVPRK